MIKGRMNGRFEGDYLLVSLHEPIDRSLTGCSYQQFCVFFLFE